MDRATTALFAAAAVWAYHEATPPTQPSWKCPILQEGFAACESMLARANWTREDYV